MSHRARYRILFWFSCIGLPASLISALFLLNAVNPMSVAFLMPFEVVNASGEDVNITPVGAVGASGLRTTLPMSLSPHLSIPSLRNRSFRLAAGARRNFTYDWDDVEFSELLIVSHSGSAKELVVNPPPTDGNYRPPRTNRFVIPLLETLPSARQEVHAVINTPRSLRLWFIWVLVLIGFGAPIGFVYARFKLKATSRKHRT